MIKLKTLQVKNFKSFQDVTIHLDPDFNVFTGVNNSGKTNLLEAISLWHECFNLLIRQAQRNSSKNSQTRYQKGDYILGTTQDKYFTYEQIKTVRSVYIDDIFYLSDYRNATEIILNFEKNTDAGIQSLNIGFQIKRSGTNSTHYMIELVDYNHYDFTNFNQFFSTLPHPISSTFVSPVSAIPGVERYLMNPQIVESIQKRQSIEVIRNRIFNLDIQRTRSRSRENLYENFIQDLSDILFQGDRQIEFFVESDPDRDVNVIINYKLGAQDTPKDIALLGSGTLQIIAILLSLYAPEQRTDLNLILFDEPDSHIHRDIQKRLLDKLSRFSPQSQIFLTTHNESFIRQVSLNHLFHIEKRSQAVIYSLASQTIRVSQHFKGIYPSSLTPVIASLGETNGLDFINAIEADRIIFVEGADDAQAIYSLLQKNVIGINTKKYSFWVLGGINHIFKNISDYKTVFQAIKNEKTLWDKSILVFDKDFLTDSDRIAIVEGFTHQSLKIKTYIASAYTWESILLTDLNICASLLNKWVSAYHSQVRITIVDLHQKLRDHYDKLKTQIQARLEDQNAAGKKELEQIHYRYSSLKRDLGQQGLGDLIQGKNDVSLVNLFNAYYQDCLEQGEFFKLANKEDVEFVLANTLAPYGLHFSIEDNFLELIDCVDRSTWFPDWNFITRL